MRILPAGPEAAALGAELIREGRLVVVPTETVYGLAAAALDSSAVEGIYAAKGRPSSNPLIVHVESAASVSLVADVSVPAFSLLAERFWPGPLTVVLPRRACVPSVTTGGLDTVAVRVPANETLRQLISLSGPVAAPSANLFMGVSPTRVEHLSAELLSHVSLVIDGGPCEVGLESTVVDLCGRPRVLRPGAVSSSELSWVLGQSVLEGAGEGVFRSPGMHPRHYAPRTRLRLVSAVSPDAAGLVFGEASSALQISMPFEGSSYAALLYDALHRLDAFGVEEAEVEMPPHGPEWVAVWDRLRRAVAVTE